MLGSARAREVQLMVTLKRLSAPGMVLEGLRLSITTQRPGVKIGYSIKIAALLLDSLCKHRGMHQNALQKTTCVGFHC